MISFLKGLIDVFDHHFTKRKDKMTTGLQNNFICIKMRACTSCMVLILIRPKLFSLITKPVLNPKSSTSSN